MKSVQPVQITAEDTVHQAVRLWSTIRQCWIAVDLRLVRFWSSKNLHIRFRKKSSRQMAGRKSAETASGTASAKSRRAVGYRKTASGLQKCTPEAVKKKKFDFFEIF